MSSTVQQRRAARELALSAFDFREFRMKAMLMGIDLREVGVLRSVRGVVMSRNRKFRNDFMSYLYDNIDDLVPDGYARTAAERREIATSSPLDSLLARTWVVRHFNGGHDG